MWKEAGVWRQLEDFFLEWCGFALFGYVDVLAHFYFPFGFCQAVNFSFQAVFLLLVAGVCKMGWLGWLLFGIKLSTSRYGWYMMMMMALHSCKIFCSLKRVFTYIAISFGLDRSWKKKNEGSAHSAGLWVVPCVYTISVVKPQRREYKNGNYSFLLCSFSLSSFSQSV